MAAPCQSDGETKWGGEVSVSVVGQATESGVVRPIGLMTLHGNYTFIP